MLDNLVNLTSRSAGLSVPKYRGGEGERLRKADINDVGVRMFLLYSSPHHPATHIAVCHCNADILRRQDKLLGKEENKFLNSGLCIV